MASLRVVERSGRDALAAATELLLDARGDDPMAGLWEAGDVQWWWKDVDRLASSRDTFWLDAEDQPIAALLEAEGAADAVGPVGPGEIVVDLVWRSTADAVVRAEVFPAVLARLAELAHAAPERTVSVSVDERESELGRLVERIGFRRDSAGDQVQLWQRPAAPPVALPLPPGMRFDDDRSRPPGRPHHLTKRNGERVAERLRETSLYRPDLDLCVRTEAGDVAAYCLCWLDPVNRVGLFEPVRTEDAYQRRGIGKALMTEGIRRLMTAGADLIKVSAMSDSAAARRLYASVGFREAFAKLRYVGGGSGG